MTMTPDLPKQTVLHRAELRPADHTVEPGTWNRFKNFLYEHLSVIVGLSHRWAQAKVHELEIENATKIQNATKDFEQAEILIRKERAGVRILQAEARNKEEEARIKKLVRQRMEVADQSPQEALEHLQAAIKQIQMRGGCVEIRSLEPPEDPG